MSAREDKMLWRLRTSTLVYSPYVLLHNARAAESSSLQITEKKQSFWWVALPGVLGFFTLVLAGTTESLWVDELHTSWSIAGEWSEVASRASLGNQSPWYFYLVRLSCVVLGPSEFSLRLPSALSYVGCGLLVLCWIRNKTADHASLAWPAALGISAWLFLDRTTLFYATEARVYALLMFVNLLGWLIIDFEMSHGFTSPPRRGVLPDWLVPWLPFVWAGSAAMSIHLHLVGLLPVCCQVLVLCSFLRARSTRNRWLAAIFVAAVCSAPALGLAQTVWGRRTKWESFAGDASWSAIRHLFPWWAYLLPATILGLIKLFVPFSSTGEERGVTQASSTAWLWCVACFGPVLMAWVATASGIAPLLHQRYLICSAIPLMLICLSQVRQVRCPGKLLVSWLAVLIVCGGLVSAHGWQRVWSQGAIVGHMRLEDWRAVSHWLESQLEPEDRIWVASGLIEGNDLEPPLEPELDAYLSYPLRGLYGVGGAEHVPAALVGNANFWLLHLLEDPNSGDYSQFIVARCPASTLGEILKRLQKFCVENHVEFAVRTPPKGFDVVSVAEVVVAR